LPDASNSATGHRGHDTATGHRGHDTATVVIAVGASTINLALGKPATQSSTFLYHSSLLYQKY
jgi:hypothetical protein